MKKLITLSLFLFLAASTILQAQRPGGGTPGAGGGRMPGGMPPGGLKNLPKIGRLYGKIVDADNKQPIPYASVAILGFPKDSVVGGSLTQDNGDFNIEGLPMGPLKVKVTSLGYTDFSKRVMVIPPDNVEQDLGNIAISANAKLLNSVEVVAQKSTLQMGIDRKIFNVEKNINSQGGTAEDVMKTVPSVTVDADGNAQLRNNSATLYIDGKPTTLALNQIPANQIEQIEIITNPSAKFDASTTGGILNLVMKKNTAPGYNGIVSASAGTGNHYNGFGNLNIKQAPFNLSLNYNINAADQPTDGYSYRVNHFPGGRIPAYFNTTNRPDNARLFSFGRVALDYSLNNRNTITLAENIFAGNFNIDDKQYFNTLNTGLDTTTYGNRNFATHNHFNNYGTELGWRKTYPKKGQELTANLKYEYSKSSSISDNLTNTDSIQSLSPRMISLSRETDHNVGGSHSNQLTLQLDYTNPVNDSTKIEMGVRSFMNHNTSDFQYNIYNDNAQDFINIPSLSNHYDLTSLINAAYFTYSSRLHGWNYQAGLRFEQSSLTGVQSPSETKVTAYNYPSGVSDLPNALFPSLFLTRKVGTNDDIQFNFSRKIHRPDFMALMPTLIVLDKFTYRQGNPTLKPELINLAEFNYSKLFGQNNLIFSLYLRNIEQQITNITIPYPADPTINLSTFVNANSTTIYGTDITLKVQLGKNVEWTNSFNGFNVNLSTDTIHNSGWSANAKTNFSIKVTPTWTLQLSGAYESKRINLQGYTKPQAFSDISVKKDFNRFSSLTLSVNDVFDSRRNINVLQTTFYDQEQLRRRETRFVKLGFSFRFGKMDASIFRKRKPTDDQQQQAPGDF